MDEVYHEDQPSPVTASSPRQIIQIVILGAVIGLLVWGATFVLETYVLRMILCQGEAPFCSSSNLYANILSAIVAMGVGLIGLVRLQVFRPLLVALATTICLWGLIGVTALLPWYEVGIACVMLYALSYIVFAWIARIRLFSLALLLAVVLVVIVHFVLVA